MQFRVRPSSKKSNHDTSIIEFPTSKSLLHGQTPMPRSFAARIDHLQVALSSFQDQYRREKEINNSSNLEIQKRLDRVEYKAFSAQQDLRQLNEIKEIKPMRESISTSISDTSKNEIAFLRQMLQQEKEAQKESLKHQNAIIQQLSLKQLRTEQEFREMMTQQRMDYQHRMNGQGEEIREFEGMKQRKIEQQYEMIKGMIATSERRMMEQVDRKIKSEGGVREYVEEQINILREQLSSQHKQTIATQTKFIRETKQSMQSLFGLINNLKKELGDELSETQKLSVKSIQKLSMTVDISRAKSNDELKQIAVAQQDINNQLVQIRNFVTNKLEENRQIMSEFQEQTMEKLEQSGEFTKHPQQKGSNDVQKMSFLQKELNQWKSITQQKNLNVFKEISNTLKTMKLEWRKENDELVSEVAALNQSIKTMKKSAPNQMKKGIQTLITIFNNEFDVLAEQLQSMTEMISVAKKQIEKEYKESLAKQGAEHTQALKTLISQKGKQNSLYTDKAINRSEETMRGYVTKEVKYSSQLLNQRLQKIEAQMSQLQLALKKASLLTTAQLEQYSLKMKTFNENYKDYLQEQRKEDMKKRIQLEDIMRKNASNLMDICYKKSQFLVEGLKNNIEISQMKEKVEAAQALDAVKDELKKDTQVSKQEMQRQFAAGMQKLTKERQNSEQILHQAIEQSVNTVKTSITNDISALKTQTQAKINQIIAKEAEMQQQIDKDMLELKNTVLGMMRDEKKLNEENNQKTRKEIDERFKVQQQHQKERDALLKQDMSKDKKQIENLIITTASKQENLQRQEMDQIKASLEEKITLQGKNIAELSKKLDMQIKAEDDKLSKLELETKAKDAETQKKLASLVIEVQAKNKATNDKIDATNIKIGEIQLNNQKDHLKNEEDRGKITQSLKNQVELKNKSLSDKIEEINKINQQTKTKQAELQAKLASLNQDLQFKNKTVTDKIQETNKQIVEIKATVEKDHIKIEEDHGKSVQTLKNQIELKNKAITDKLEEINKNNIQLHAKDNELQTKITTINQQIKVKNEQNLKNGQEKSKSVEALKTQFEQKNKILTDKIEEINKKFAQESKAKAEKEKENLQQNQSISKADEIQKKIKDLTIVVDTKDKTTTQQIQQLNKKIGDLITNNEKQKLKEGEGKKVGEQTVNQLKIDLEKQIKQLSARIEQVQDKIKHDDQEEAINTVRKSVNKLEAMVFSQQAKNKALFDRMTEDINRITQHLNMITNQMRE